MQLWNSYWRMSATRAWNSNQTSPASEENKDGFQQRSEFFRHSEPHILDVTDFGTQENYAAAGCDGRIMPRPSIWA